MAFPEAQHLDALHANPLFSVMSQERLRQFADQLEAEHFKAGDTLIVEGDHQTDCMYLLVQGELHVHEGTSDMVINTLTQPGASAGEVGLLTGQNRIASIRANTDVEVIRLTKPIFEKLLDTAPDLSDYFVELIQQRIQQTYLARILCGLLGDMTADELHELQARLTWHHLRRGEVLFSQGDTPNEMYIVVNGRLQARVEGENGRPAQVIGEIAIGETVGEIGLLNDTPRMATVQAIRETYVLRMSREAFVSLSAQYPQLTTRIAQIVVKRQHELLSQAKARRTSSLNLVLVPLSPEVDLTTLAQQLYDEISAFGSVLLLSADSMSTGYGIQDAANRPVTQPSNVLISGWMSQLESQYEYLLYVADGTWSPWTERCITHADRVVLVGKGGADTALTPVEQTIAVQYPDIRHELILVHDPATERPSDTRFWFVGRTLSNHYHIRQGDQGHIRRAARRLTGHAVGVVLSGGGARGYAHIGVLGTLEQQGIQVDMIGGTSIGALVGAGYAKYSNYATCQQFAAEFGDTRKLFDYTFPFVSIMATHKVTTMLRQVIGEDLYIEDLWMPYFCVATDLTRSETLVYKSGLLWQAIRASLSIPAVFSPVMRDGSVVVDGGITNNFPLDIMHDWLEGGTLIGVMAKSSKISAASARYDIGESVNGWQVLWQRINPLQKRKPRVPTLPGTILRMMAVNSLMRLRDYEHLADLIIYPDVSQYGMLQFSDYAPIIQAGFDSAGAVVADWAQTQPEYIRSGAAVPTT